MADNTKPKKPIPVAKHPTKGFWNDHGVYADDPDHDELLVECSRLRSKLRRALMPSDIIKLMRSLGWQKVSGVAIARPDDD